MPPLRAPSDLLILTLDSVTKNSATYTVTCAEHFDAITGNIEATANGTSVYASLSLPVGESSTTVTFTGLDSNTTYTIAPQTVGGYPITQTYTFTTLNAAKMYGSVNGASKRISKLYGSVKIPAYRYIVSAIDNNPSFDSSRFDNKWNSTYGIMTEAPTEFIVATNGTTTTAILRIYGRPYPLFSYVGAYVAQGNSWGFNQAPVNGTVHSVVIQYGYNDVAKKIIKLYGSVNGSAKLIYEDTNA